MSSTQANLRVSNKFALGNAQLWLGVCTNRVTVHPGSLAHGVRPQISVGLLEKLAAAKEGRFEEWLQKRQASSQEKRGVADWWRQRGRQTALACRRIRTVAHAPGLRTRAHPVVVPCRLHRSQQQEQNQQQRQQQQGGGPPLGPSRGYGGLMLPGDLRGLLSVEPEVRQALASSRRLGSQLLKQEAEELHRVKEYAQQLVAQECRWEAGGQHVPAGARQCRSVPPPPCHGGGPC